LFIAVEKEPPFAVGLYNLDAESIEIGRQKNEQNLVRLQECIEANNYPAYSTEIQTISLPNWAKKTL
jgi:exodeoxyribonuclease VIII